MLLSPDQASSRVSTKRAVGRTDLVVASKGQDWTTGQGWYTKILLTDLPKPLLARQLTRPFRWLNP
jgi:hypothetical protein